MRETGFVFGGFCAFLLKRQEKPCKGGMTAGWWSVVGCVRGLGLNVLVCVSCNVRRILVQSLRMMGNEGP
jgi:hypothetical protein